MLKVVKNTVLAKMPKIYLYVFACNKKARFERDQKFLRIEEENLFLREDYLKSNNHNFNCLVLKNQLKMYENGDLVLN